MRERLLSTADRLRASFGFPSAVAIAVAIVVGFGLPALDNVLAVRLPLFSFDSVGIARSLLETIATATVSVAGLSFSVTLVAFTLTASQLSPRVLRTFSADRLSQMTLALFLGTFVYCLVVLVRLGSVRSQEATPDLSMTVAILLATASFGLFAAFISHIVEMLQPASVVSGIVGDAHTTLDNRFPAEAGAEPEDPEAARRTVRGRVATPGYEVRARGEGFVSDLHGAAVVAAAQAHDGLVRQRAAVGDYVVVGDVLAELWCPETDALDGPVAEAFVLERQRSPLHDLAFPIRQLADIALKGLSPGVNDPTTAQSAMFALTAILVRVAQAEALCEVRVDPAGAPRLVTIVPELDGLVLLGFEQVRIFASADPVVCRSLVSLLEKIGRSAARAELTHREVDRQIALIGQAAEAELTLAADARGVVDAAERR